MAKIDSHTTHSNAELAALLKAMLTDLTNLRTSVVALTTLANELKADYNATLAKMDTDFADVTNASVDYAATNPVASADAPAVPALTTENASTNYAATNPVDSASAPAVPALTTE